MRVLESCRHENIPVIYAGSSTKLSYPGELGSPYALYKSTVAKELSETFLASSYTILFPLFNVSLCMSSMRHHIQISALVSSKSCSQPGCQASTHITIITGPSLFPAISHAAPAITGLSLVNANPYLALIGWQPVMRL